MRRLPLYNYTLQPNADIEFSDVEDLIYINAVENNKSVVLIYRPSAPVALSLYHTIYLNKLYSRPALEIEVSGYMVDFLNIKTDS